MQARGARVLVTLSLLFGALVVTGTPASSVTENSTISYVSEPGDYVGQGGSDTFTPADSNPTIWGTAQRIFINSFRDAGHWIQGQISAPPGKRLAPGPYENASALPPGFGIEPGIMVGLNGRGCARGVGSFIINAVYFDSADVPVFLDADLEQQCELPTAATLHVHILINDLAAQNPPSAADDAVTVESDTNRTIDSATLLSNDRDPDNGDTPVAVEVTTGPSHGVLVPGPSGFVYTPDAAFEGTDSFTYRAVGTGGDRSAPANVVLTVGTLPQDLLSDSAELGEAISLGISGTFTHADSSFAVSGVPGDLTVVVRGKGQDWGVRIAAPFGDSLVPGQYLNATQVASTAAPRIEISDNGRACPHTYGSFTINAIGFAPDGTPNMLDADLEQHCESPTAPALHASIRYHIPAVRPVTNTDEFNAVGTKDVPSPGVLANDTDADPRNALTSSIMSPPLHGSVTLDPSGAFRYQPAAGFVGDDRFVYRAADPFGLKSVPTVVTMHTTLPKDTVWVRAFNGSNTAYGIGGPITGGDVRMTTRSGVALLNGAVTLPDGLGGSATITFTTRNGSVGGSVVGTVTVVDPLLGGTSRFRITDTRSPSSHRAGGHALRISGSVGRLTFSAHDRVTPSA